MSIKYMLVIYVSSSVKKMIVLGRLPLISVVTVVAGIMLLPQWLQYRALGWFI